MSYWRDELAHDTGAKVAFQLLDMVGKNPFLTPRGVEQSLGIAYNTVMRAIGQLEKQGIVNEIAGAKRDRVFCATKLLHILEEPARLTPLGNF